MCASWTQVGDLTIGIGIHDYNEAPSTQISYFPYPDRTSGTTDLLRPLYGLAPTRGICYIQRPPSPGGTLARKDPSGSVKTHSRSVIFHSQILPDSAKW